MAKPKLFWDPRVDQPLEVSSYFHCAQCLEELAEGVSPKDYQRIQAGVTKDGSIQVWCIRHECNIIILSGEPRPGLDYGAEG